MRGDEEQEEVRSADIAAMEHVSTNTIGSSSVVMLRQVIGGVPAGIDGLVVIAVDKGSARYVSSTLAPLRGSSSARRAASQVGSSWPLTRTVTRSLEAYF